MSLDDTAVFMILTTGAPFDVEHVDGGLLQCILAISNQDIQESILPRHVLEPQTHGSCESMNEFRDFEVGDGEAILLLTSSYSIIIDNVTVRKDAILVIGHMSLDSMRVIANICEFPWTASEAGIYRIACHSTARK